MKEVTYVTRFKGLELVKNPMGLKDAQGNKIPSVRCSFMPTTQGYTFTTANEALITWLDKHEYMRSNKIQRAVEGEALETETVEVTRKGITSNVKEEPEAPVTPIKKPHVAKISK